MSDNKYLTYSPEDFAADAYFQNWVLEKDPMADVFWKNWIKSHPDKENDIQLAREIIEATARLKFKKYTASEEDFSQVWHNIVLQQAEGTPQTGLTKKHASYWKWLSAACVALLVSGIVLFQYLQTDQTVYFTTGYNEVINLTLPDGSDVVLNANSRLSYDPHWEKERKVYLEGEAFFSVTHTVDHKKFTVYASDLGVEVLGTEFEVKNRRGKMRVILRSGRVKLNIPEIALDGGHPDDFIMNPGELVEYSERHKGVMKKKVDTEKYTAWTRNEIIFENASLMEVAEVIEDHYGYRVTFENEALQRRVFTARINDKSDINLLINILQETFNLNIYKNENNLIIESK